MNAVLAEQFAGGWSSGGLHVGKAFVIVTLVSEGALLFVAAQAGFVDGPRVMANMARRLVDAASLRRAVRAADDAATASS